MIEGVVSDGSFEDGSIDADGVASIWPFNMNSVRDGGLYWSVGSASAVSDVLANRGVTTNNNSDFSV